MQSLINIIANRAAESRINRVLGMLHEAITFPVARLRLCLRQLATDGPATMLRQHSTASITAMADSWRCSYAPCPAGIRHKHANLGRTRVSARGFGRCG